MPQKALKMPQGLMGEGGTEAAVIAAGIGVSK